jgi:hypothetical protein
LLFITRDRVLKLQVELVTEIRALAYSNTNGNTLAIGSHDGLLKLVEFKEMTNSNTQARISSVKDITCSITRNESLRGHIETVNHLSWLPSSSSCGKGSKLMSTDVHGYSTFTFICFLFSLLINKTFYFRCDNWMEDLI